jgi:hypothetical protein
MWRHLSKAALCGAYLCLAGGCIEMTKTISLNPAGKGKVHYDIRVAYFPGQVDGASEKKKKKSLAEMKQETVAAILTDANLKRAARLEGCLCRVAERWRDTFRRNRLF